MMSQTHLSPEELAVIRGSFHRLLAERGDERAVRAASESDAGYDVDLWRRIAALGIAALAAPAEAGGAGAGAVLIEHLMEEAGAALLCAPLLSTGVMAVGLLAGSPDQAALGRLVPPMAAGEVVATVALTGERGLWNLDDVEVTAERRDGAWRLDGVASFVLHGVQASLLLVVARHGSGLMVFEVDPATDGVRRERLQAFDKTMPMARITFTAASASPIEGCDRASIESALDLARVALAGEQAGAARKVLDFTLDYLRTRVQFGRPIGGFQALKHMAADLYLDVEGALSAARAAAEAMEQGRPDSQALINLAAFTCSDVFSNVAATAVQMHGGIAFTWDHPAHLYLRRARADARFLGGPDYYRERYVSVLEGRHD